MATSAPDRIISLDTVRGVAVMGILLLNIVAFAMPPAAYFNPAAYGGHSGTDLYVYLGNLVLFDGKMRGLFSFLFGASMLLVIEGAEAKGESAARVHYSRMFWLLLFGLAHLWLVWWGDILNLYALIGMIAFLFRRKQVPTLIGAAVALIVIQTLMMGSLAGMVAYLQSIVDGGDPAAAQEAAKGLAGFNDGFGRPGPEAIAKTLAEYRGDYATVVAARFKEAAFSPISSVLLFGWETLAYMLLGMASLKSGLLAGTWARGRYVRWLLVCFAIGIPAYCAIAWWVVSSDFALMAVVGGVMTAATPVRPLMVVGWACLILLLMRPGGAISARIAAAGRMAFTNYLMTSLICTTLFYGYGLGWYGYLSRAELYLVVALVWLAMLLWSKPWLDHFRYGPLEWVWRSLSRGSLQPMRGAASAGG
ncbi:DUF418 domain-containing protein [Sphingomonas canadensis]|uniref:DUF418 domain-containing protein n=1 Tax=Sphingomonas canadensis TaxID=1219257 RepID=A0ABW3H3X0_9SPHN|nr:DUF418 domain-containing protein [Sphingomonas canadensis]MCW3835470.1 DUF418 domain-containing protein [Sphingomonas canadensis]